MSDSRPDISVIIPTYNRRDVVLDCLRELDRQTIAPERMEVVVVDDGSADDTRDAVRALGATMRCRVICERQENGGASSARNRAIGLASGRILLIINDDTMAFPDMLEMHLRFHEEFPDDGVSGLGRLYISPKVPESIFVHLHHDTYLDTLPDRFDLGWQFFMTFNISCKAALLDKGGLFDTTLRWYEDLELGLRLKPHGLRVLLIRDAIGHHYHPMDEAKYLRIADSDGGALAVWLSRNRDLIDEFTPIGMHFRTLGTREFRHVVADTVINAATWPLWIRLARAMIGPLPGPAFTLYRKLFQWRRRRAFDAVWPKASAGTS